MLQKTEIKERVIESAIRHGLIKSPSELKISNERGFNNKAKESAELFMVKYSDELTLSDVQIIRIFRYFMGKAAETCIADELYKSDKERICNVTYLLSDVDNEYFHINIPPHYMFELSDLSMHYLLPLKEAIESMKSEDYMKDLSLALIYWQMVAYIHAHKRNSYTAQGRYDNSKIKTLDEIRICAFNGMLQNLSSNGWKIEKMNYLLSNPWNVIGKYNGNDCMLLLRTNYGFFDAGITIEELSKLADYAKSSEGKNYSIGYVLANIHSANEQHKEDHVILIGDQMRFEIKDLQMFGKREE